jgi:hypothetical protein
MSESHFVDSVMLVFIAAISKIVDDEYTHPRQREESLTCPLLDQMRRHHRQRRKRSAFAMDMDCSKRDQSLARATLRDHHARSCLLPTFGQTHNRDRLRGKRLSQQSFDSW